jgi:hypothetical protein
LSHYPESGLLGRNALGRVYWLPILDPDLEVSTESMNQAGPI